MDFESEVIAQEFLPAVRCLIAKKLSREYGYLQEEIAEELGLTQPAVSKYLNGDRASKENLEKMKQDPQITVLIEEIVSKTAKEENPVEEYRQLLETVKSKGILEESFQNLEKL